MRACAGSIDVYDGAGALGDRAELQDRPPSPVPQRRTTWLFVECTDRKGILAEVAALIAAHSHNITVRRPCPLLSM